MSNPLSACRKIELLTWANRDGYPDEWCRAPMTAVELRSLLQNSPPRDHQQKRRRDE